MLLDEPTSGLDPALRQDFYEIIGELAANGATVLLSSHALAEIEHRTDRVVAMDRGRKVADGTLADLRRLSGSPTRIRIRLPEGVQFHPAGLLGMAEHTVLSDGAVEIRCPDAAKLDRSTAVARDVPATCRPRHHVADARRHLRRCPPAQGRGMMRAIRIIAGRELRDGIRNRRVIATTLLLAALALTLALLGSAPTGTVRVSPLSVTVVSLSSLTIFLVPLIALLIAHDAIAGEFDRGTMLLLLSYPVRRWQIIAGKFVGHVGILAFATLLGYGAAGIAVGFTGGVAEPGAVMAFVVMVGSSVLLGAAFTALGYVASVLTRDQRAAAGVALGLWLFFILLYDMALLGLLVADQGRTITVGLLNLLLLANPADIYRLLNLTGFSNVGMLTGMAGLTGEVMFGKAALVAALLAWVGVPLVLAGVAFSRRQV